MAVSIQSYINKNANDVEIWISNLCSSYAEKLILKEEDTSVDFDRVCRDDRRSNKVREVLEHYGLVDRVESVSSNVGLSYYSSAYNRATYKIHVNHEGFEKISLGLAEPFEFETTPPDKSTDRILGYPTVANIHKAGTLHIYHYPELYNIYDRKELAKHGNRWVSSHATRKVVRVYPKNLESSAEKEVFRRALKDYYSENIPKFVKLMFGFDTDMLTKDRAYTENPEKELKNLYPSRVNDIESLKMMTPERLSTQVKDAEVLLKYAKKSLKDLKQVQEGIEKYGSFDVLMENFEILGGEEAILNAPLMMSSEDELAKKLATLVLKGSNKGLI